MQVQLGVQKKTFNPYLVFYSQKMMAKKMNDEILKMENPRYMSEQLKQQLAVIEEKQLKQDIIKTMRQA